MSAVTNIEWRTRADAHRELSDLLGQKVPLDGLLCSLSGARVIDLVALDISLKKHAGAKYKDEESMRDFVLRTFGKRAVELILLLLNTESYQEPLPIPIA